MCSGLSLHPLNNRAIAMRPGWWLLNGLKESNILTNMETLMINGTLQEFHTKKIKGEETIIWHSLK